MEIIGTPDPLSVNVDADILQVGELHDLSDVVGPFLEDDLAVGCALCECLFDLGCVIAGAERRDGTC